jgi:hypothetical protein
MWTVVPDVYNVIIARIFRLQYSADRICAATGDISTIQCALYYKHWAKYSAPPPIYATWTVVLDTYNIITARLMQASIFNWTYLRCYSRYHDNSMPVILKTWWQRQGTSSSLRYVICGPRHIQCKYSTAYSGLNVQVYGSALLLEISRQCYARYSANWVRDTAYIL